MGSGGVYISTRVLVHDIYAWVGSVGLAGNPGQSVG